MVAGRYWTWHFYSITIIESGWVIPFTSHLTIGLPHHPSFGVNATNPSQCRQHVQEKSFNWETTIQLMPHPLQYLQPSFFMTTIPEPCVVRSFSPLEIICFVSCRRCGIHQGPPTMSHFLSTSTHYQRIWLRNTPFSTLKLACLNGKFLTSGERFTSLAFNRKILRGVRRQVLYSQHVNCTVVPWGSSSFSVIPLVLVNSLHHWLVIRQCLSMFDFRTSLHMDWLVHRAKIEWVWRPQI